MAEKYLNENVVVDMPPESFETEPLKLDEQLPPSYEYPQMNFSHGCKDWFFAILFWIHAIGMIVIGIVFGVPIVLPYIKQKMFDRMDVESFDPTTKLFFYSLGGAVATSGVISVITFFLLQQCAGAIIKCSLAIIVFLEIVLLTILLLTVSPVASIGPLIILLCTLAYIYAIRNRIAFTEVHLRVGSSVIRTHSSLIFIAILMFIMQFLWFIFWSLAVLGILHVSNHPLLHRYMNKEKTKIQESDIDIISKIILFCLLFSFYWGSTTLANIVHFISACTVGRWWFTADANEQYTLGNSFKRAFTTNFGTICLGSLLEAFIKALRSAAESKRREGIGAWIAACILGIIESIIGYINEWAFVYSALTGQSFIQSSRSFFDLFTKRGWTMIINDSLVQNCATIVNFIVALIAAAVGGLIAYLLVENSAQKISLIVTITMTSFLIGIFLSATMTTILSSCVRTIFVCFALNPAALGATHPDHLESLTKVWHKFYPQEFAASGYGNQYPISSSESTV